VTKEHEKMVVGPFLSCHNGRSQLGDFLREIFSILPFSAGTAKIPKNVIKKDVFYRAFF